MDNNEMIINEEQVPVIETMADNNLFVLAETAEKRVDAMKRIITASLRITNESDWVKIGSAYYLQSTGAEKIARTFGISYQILDTQKRHKDNGHFVYEYKMRFTMSNVTIEADGIRSSDDEFFTGKVKTETLNDGTIHKLSGKTPDEVDERDVKLSAYTNCLNNGIKRLIGLRNVSDAQLKDAGLNIDEIRGYGFNSKQPKEMNQSVQDARDEIMKILTEWCNGDEKRIGDAIEKYTTFVGKDGHEIKGKRTLDGMSEKALLVNLVKIRKAYEDWKKEHGREANQ